MVNQIDREHQSPIAEVRISPQIVDALRGKISEPTETISHKPGSQGEIVRVRIALEGPGMFGLTDMEDNKTWSGMFNHQVKSGVLGAHLSTIMAQAGHDTSPSRIANTMAVVSHAGRRQWEEARDFPDMAPNAKEKRALSNETLGMHLIQGKVPQSVFDLTVALGHNTEDFSVDPAVYTSWDYLIAIYADHRTTQQYEPLHTRMGDFLLSNFFEKGTITPDIKEQVYIAIAILIDRQKRFRFGEEGTHPVPLDEADAIAAQLGARPDSARLVRKDLIRLILQDADTEATLIQAGVNPDAINDETIPLPQWEDDLRYAYVAPAQENIASNIYGRIRAFHQWSITDEVFDLRIFEKLNADFPENSWWGRYARKVFYDWHETHQESNNIRGGISYEQADNDLIQNFPKSR